MPRFTLALALAVLPLLGACATRDGDKVHREVSAVVQDEAARAKVVDAIQKGATPAEAMDKVSGGPKRQQPIPN